MFVDEEIREGVAVLHVRGPLANPQDVESFRTRIEGLVRRGHVQVVVDFSQAPWFGAAMLSALIHGLKTLRAAGGDLKLAGVSAKGRVILAITRMFGVFTVLETVDTAIESFRRFRLNAHPV